MKKLFSIVCLFVFLAGCDANQSNTSSTEPTKSSAKAAESPHAIIKTVTGELIDFSHLKRKWVIVNYWANWCEPCKKEIPELNKFADEHQSDVYLVGVNYDGVSNNQLLELIAQNEIHYFSALTDPTQQLGLGDIPGLPITFVFNNKGKLLKQLTGPQTQASLEEVIK